MESAAAKSIKISTKPEDATRPDQARLEGKYGHHLSALDLDGDGFLSRYEVLSFIERTVEAAKQLKSVKLLLGASLALLLLFSLASFGLTWAVVALSKEVKVFFCTAAHSTSHSYLHVLLRRYRTWQCSPDLPVS